MSLNEILIAGFVVLGALLLYGVMFRVALHYRDKAQELKEQISNLKKEIREKDIRYLKESKQTIDECDADLKERDEMIEELKQKIDEYDGAFILKNEMIEALKADVRSRDEEVERLTQELKQRDKAVKAPPHKKSKKKSK
ncbi:Membrane-bound metallopeptidase [Candidatus Bartonella washoeensis]|uniref:hypothetical protein n=1 Tax=Candidatus Bartonella washoeensis TaxID=186739 RepID=UPI000D8872D7|nr:hypothetical protein [Bartonella washoeensis]SPU26469.1 Membrane-bound metallopeptidase [Bartonella washoeensis]